MEINYVLGVYPDLHEAMVAKVYENDSGAEVASITIPERNSSNVPTVGAGHQHEYTVVFSGLDARPHTLKLFTASATQLQNFNIQPTTTSVTVYDPVHFKIGDGEPGTPAIGDAIYTNTALAGLTNDEVYVWRNGSFLYPGQIVDMNILGGFALVQTGDVFSLDEEFIILRKPTVVNNPVHDSVVGKRWGGNATIDTIYVDVTTPMNYVPEHLRHIFRISGTGAYHFTASEPVPIGYEFKFINMVSGNPKVYFENGTLIYPGGNISEWTVPQGCIATFTWDGTCWNMVGNCSEPVQAYSITYMGTAALGNIGAGGTPMSGYDSSYLITIPTQGGTNYKVFGSLLSNSANINSDNDSCWGYKRISATQFQLGVRKLAADTTNLNFDFMITKAN